MTENIRSQTAAVIPAYQDEKHIGDIARRTRERLDHVLVVDDGSTDETAQRAREAGAEVIVHDQNRAKAKQSRPAWRTGLALGIRRAADKIGKSHGWSSWIPMVNIFPKRSIDFCWRRPR